MTLAVSKQLLPVYDKPMVYYPLSALLLAGIRDILAHLDAPRPAAFPTAARRRAAFGISLSYAVQPRPEGLGRRSSSAASSSATTAWRSSWATTSSTAMAFRPRWLRPPASRRTGATIFAYPVRDPERFGVVEFDASGKARSLVEKPQQPRSHFAVPGLYFYDNEVVALAAALPSRAHAANMEITDLNRVDLDRGMLHVEKLGRGFAWLDTGTPDSLLQASAFVQTVQERQGLKIACLEEIALHMGYCTADELTAAGERMKNDFGRYLVQIAAESQTEEQVHDAADISIHRHHWSERAAGEGAVPAARSRRRSAA